MYVIQNLTGAGFKLPPEYVHERQRKVEKPTYARRNNYL